jgi:hypothetical protein
MNETPLGDTPAEAPRISRLMHAIEIIEGETVHKTLTLGELVHLLGDMGNGILIVLFCLVFMQPIPLPGISTPIGTVVAILATLQYFHREPAIPVRFRRHAIPQKALHKVSEVARRLWKKIERFLHPRLLFLTRAPVFRFINWILVVVAGVLLALPLPIPFSNTVPAIVILLITFAQLEDDGFLALGGYAVSVVMSIFFFSIGAGLWSFAQRP